MKIKRFIGGNLESNCYIVSLNKDGCCFAVDPGYNSQKLIKYIEDEQILTAVFEIFKEKYKDEIDFIDC